MRGPTNVYLLSDARMMGHCCVHLDPNGCPTCVCRHNDSSPGGGDDEDDLAAKLAKLNMWQKTRCIEDPPHEENPNRILAIHSRLLSLEDRLLADIYPWSHARSGSGSASMPNDGKAHRSHDENGGAGVEDDEEEEKYGASSESALHTVRRFTILSCIPADRKTIEMVHSSKHYEFMARTATLSEQELLDLAVPGDLYFNNYTFLAATLAAGGVVQCVNATMDPKTETTRAIALVRPPGHHAGSKGNDSEAQGFCYFNNCAIAAKHAIHTGRANRVFILDIDIHHGNGIQDLTYDDPDIFYLSIHRGFYPWTGKHDETGEGDAVGTNLNIVWGQGGMGDTEYAEAFHNVVLPAITSFSPDLIIVACGLDAAEGDLLGDCGLSPAMYYAMMNSVLSTAGQKIPLVIALEGGYNISLNADCVEAIALALLDEPWKEDKAKYEQHTYWTSKSILPQKYNSVLQKFNPFSLARFLETDPLNIGNTQSSERKHAFASIKRSTKAFRKHNMEIYDYTQDFQDRP